MRQVLNDAIGLLFLMNISATALAGWDPNKAFV